MRREVDEAIRDLVRQLEMRSEQMKQEEISLNRNMIPELEVQEGGEEVEEMEEGMHMDM